MSDYKTRMVGNVSLYLPPHSERALAHGKTFRQRRLYGMVEGGEEADYHAKIIDSKDWEMMYQLSELRANVVEWLDIPAGAKVLEIGAGCGTITEVLLKKGAAVTCQEAKPDYCMINALRHSSRQLEIYADFYRRCEKEFDADYDFIIALGALEIRQPEKLLATLRTHLKPDGTLVLTAENKLGLKYWAGNREEHTGTYFAGMDNSAADRGIQVFARKGLERLLEEAGFCSRRFFYPYPDERFAQNIYSDAYLPKKGELTNNVVNYENDRLILFDEKKVYDSLIDEGQYPLFANGFLCLARMSKEQIQVPVRFVRYAADRARAFAMRTEIVDKGDGCTVYKVPLYEEGLAHIRQHVRAYQQLSRQYPGVNRCSFHEEDGVLELEYIKGESLEHQMSQATDTNEMQKVFDIFKKMLQYIRSDKQTTPFEMTEEFAQTFGKPLGWQLLKGKPCSQATDIDLVLSNIIEDEAGNWNLIDYEWTFFFPIPQDFVIYRMIFFIHQCNPSYMAVAMQLLLRMAHISEMQARVYAQMEDYFQRRYITGGLAPYREMVSLQHRRCDSLEQVMKVYDRSPVQQLRKLAGKLKRAVPGSYGRKKR